MITYTCTCMCCCVHKQTSCNFSCNSVSVLVDLYCTYHCHRYLGYIKDLVYHSLSQAQLGGVPSTLNLVRSFLNLKQIASTPGLEVREDIVISLTKS